MDDVPIEISTEDHFSHETLSLVVCVSEIIGQTMIIGSNSSFVHRQSGNPVELCDAKYSYAIIDTYIHIHAQPCDKKSIQENVVGVWQILVRKKATERDLKSGKLCRNSL